MQRLVRLAGEVAVNRDEVARARHLAGNDDLVLPESRLDRKLGRFDGRDHHALVQDLFGAAAETAGCVLLHLRHDQLLIERAAVHPDAHRPVVIDGHPADGGEPFITARAGPDVARVDAVFVEGGRARGVAGQQLMAVVVEIADEGRRAARIEHALLDVGHGGRCFGYVDGDADELRPGFGQLDALARGRRRVSGIGHRHRLHGDRRAAADLHVSDAHADRLVESERLHD